MINKELNVFIFFTFLFLLVVTGLGCELYSLHVLLKAQAIEVENLKALLDSAQKALAVEEIVLEQKEKKISAKYTSGEVGFIVVIVIWCVLMVPAFIAAR
jgi:hypothetical protein